ncbi:MAG: AraC family transcriptional regulator [Bacillota bacterium]|nr:AraC family transcriptional regulator [Bacillota bacterium]
MAVIHFMYSPKYKTTYLAVPWHVNFGKGDNQRHIHPVYHLMVILEGNGFIERDQYDLSLAGGDLLIINPNELHVMHADDKAGLSFYSLSFYLIAQEKLAGLDVTALLNGQVDLRLLAELAETATLEQLFELTALQDQQKWALPTKVKAKLNRLILDYEPRFADLNPSFKRFWLDPQTRDKDGFASLTNLMLSEWLDILYQAGHADKEGDKPDPLLTRLYQALDGFVFRQYHHQELKTQLNYNPVYLAAYFKEKTGMTPRAYVDRQKIRQACIDLHQTNDSIETIAMRLKYSSPGHFCANFKKVMLMTPKQYRSATLQ